MTTDTCWTDPDASVEAFLNLFDTAARAGDDVGAVFADTFLALDPQRAISLTPAMLAAGLAARRRMFEQAGVGELRRGTVRQLILDDAHRLVAVEWRADRIAGDAPPLTVTSTFLLRRDSERGDQIVVYLNHTDLASALAQP